MRTFFTYLVLGIADGSVYAIAGLGLVLTFKTSGIFNFAHGVQAAAAAYLMYTFRIQHGWPWFPAALLAVLIAGVGGGLVLERMANLLARESTATRVVAMVGILVGLDALLTAIYGAATLPFKSFLPQHVVGLGSVNVTVFQMIVTGLALLAAVGLYLLFRVTRVGTAMQAVVDDPALLDMLGTSPVRVRRFAWVLGSCFASISGLLLATFLGLDVSDLTLLVVFSFGAAAVGAFSNLPLTYAGGLLIGIGQSMTTGYLASHKAFEQVPANIPFIVLVIALLVAPKRTLVERGLRAVRSADRPISFSPATTGVGGVVLVAGLCVVPFVVGFKLPIWTTGLAFVTIFASLGLLVRTSNQVSLCQMAFAAVGSSTFAHLANDGVPWLVALLLGGLVAVPIGAVVALPAIRLRGVYLAIVTLGFGILVERVFFTTWLMFGAQDNLSVNRPRFWGLNFADDKTFYFLVLAVTVLCLAAMVVLRRGRLGRMLGALAESPAVLGANGSSANMTRLIVFCISAFLAGIGGGLLGAVTSNTGGLTFDFSVSLIMIAVLFIAGRQPVLAAFLAAGLYKVAVPYIHSQTLQNYSGVVFGAAAVLVATRAVPILVERANQAKRASQRRDDPRAARTAQAEMAVVPVTGGLDLELPGLDLELEGVSVHFGGLKAVNDISLRAPSGAITGLIGPNGAGKSTTFNACAGTVAATGTISLGGRRLDGLSTPRRARAGLGRTFQRTELVDSVSVADNVAFGAESLAAGRFPWGQLIGSRRARRHCLELAETEMERCGLSALRRVACGELSTGQRRLVELARVLAAGYPFLLLDEPSSGLDHTETEMFGHIVAEVVADEAVGVLLVEHDMALIRQLCSFIYVLDFGELIYQGQSDDVLRSDVVKQAYLGTQATEAAEAMLELRDITAGYANHVVLRDVNLVVPDHSVVSLLGPNGAGKTTLLRVAGGLLAPMAGQVLLDGVDVTGWAPHRRAQAGLGHVPEGRGIFAAMTVADNLRMQTRPDADRAGIGKATDAFPRLGQRLSQVAGSLSGGEQQMLALAAMYLAEPSVVLLDEVSMGLAPNIVDEIYLHLAAIAATGAALLLVEQYVARALSLARYVYILKKGQIAFVGQPGELGEDDVLAAYLGASA